MLKFFKKCSIISFALLLLISTTAFASTRNFNVSFTNRSPDIDFKVDYDGSIVFEGAAKLTEPSGKNDPSNVNFTVYKKGRLGDWGELVFSKNVPFDKFWFTQFLEKGRYILVIENPNWNSDSQFSVNGSIR